MYQTVKIKCCLRERAEFVLAPNSTRNWTQNLETQQDFEQSCE